MRKAELRFKAENGVIIIYKAMQYRWNSDETADPQIGDETYHLNCDEAIEAANVIDLDLGFEPTVDRITIGYEEFNDGIEFREEFELCDLDDYRRFNSDIETIYSGSMNVGRILDATEIVVMYRHHMYMNYAYIIEAVKFVRETDLTTESDLRNDADRINSIYCYLVQDLDELADDFRVGRHTPFDKINSGSLVVREFLEENGHPDFIEEAECEQ